MELRYLLYASRLVNLLGHNGLRELLATSQVRNGQDNITGFLQIEDRMVLQYLEGTPEALLQTVERIRKDKRHTDFLVLAENQTAQRYFDGWQMAIVESATLSLRDILGFQIDDLQVMKSTNPMDLVSLLSANASFLRDRPSVA